MTLALVVVGAITFALCAMAYAFHREDGVLDKRDFKAKKELYRRRRDEFRGNETAMRELEEWKARNDNFEFVVL